MIEYGLLSGGGTSLGHGVSQVMDALQQLGMTFVNLALDNPLLFLIVLAAFVSWAVLQISR